MTEKLALLGSTGSVGTQALDVCRHRNIRVSALSASTDVKTLENQIREFSPSLVAVRDHDAASDLKVRVADTGVKIISGNDASEILAAEAEADTVLNSLSGVAGLRPTLATLKSGKNLALANKESLVTYGEGVMAEAKQRGLSILPVDSEHSAIFQCLTGQKIKKLILTASGGPFYGMTKEELAGITPERALAHPTWKMGKRITIDSSTLMNKGFEVIEAYWLFGVETDQIEVAVHRESIIHSMVEYIDNAVIAQLSDPDMRLCVQYALTYPERYDSPIKPLDLFKVSKLNFSRPDPESFPLLPLAFEAIKRGGVIPAAVNGADEEAVSLFLSGKISYTDISDIVCEVSRSIRQIESPSLSDIEDTDALAREMVRERARAKAKAF